MPHRICIHRLGYETGLDNNSLPSAQRCLLSVNPVNIAHRFKLVAYYDTRGATLWVTLKQWCTTISDFDSNLEVYIAWLNRQRTPPKTDKQTR